MKKTLEPKQFNKRFKAKYDIRDIVKKKFKDKISSVDLPNTTVEYAISEAKLAYEQSPNAKYKPTALDDLKFGKISLDGRNIKNGYIYPKNTKKQLEKRYPKLRNILKHLEIKSIVSEIKRNYKKKLPTNKDRLMKPNRKKSKTKEDAEFKARINQYINVLDSPTNDSISVLHYDAISETWKLCVPYQSESVKNNKVCRTAIALDPGVRTFLTWYDGNSYGEIGASMWRKLKSLDLVIDKLKSKRDRLKDKSCNKYKIKRLNKAIHRKYQRIQNIVKDMHFKACNLLTRYKYVFLPEFKVSQILKKLNKRSRKPLLNLSYFKFKMRLIQKASETGTKVIICNEAYTSKTCSMCGTRNSKLGASKVFKCSNCKTTCDRDMNAARNIFIRAYSTTFESVKQHFDTNNHNKLRGDSTRANDNSSESVISNDSVAIPDHEKIVSDLKMISVAETNSDLNSTVNDQV